MYRLYGWSSWISEGEGGEVGAWRSCGICVRRMPQAEPDELAAVEPDALASDRT